MPKVAAEHEFHAVIEAQPQAAASHCHEHALDPAIQPSTAMPGKHLTTAKAKPAVDCCQQCDQGHCNSSAINLVDHNFLLPATTTGPIEHWEYALVEAPTAQLSQPPIPR